MPVPLAEESRTYAESPAFNPLRASASKTAETRGMRGQQDAPFHHPYFGVRRTASLALRDASRCRCRCAPHLFLRISNRLGRYDSDRRAPPYAKTELVVEPDRTPVGAEDVQEWAV